MAGHVCVAGWTIAHGHRPVAADRLISGHHHPVLRVSSHAAPCFLVGDGRIILPAFSDNAAGLDVASARLPAELGTSSLRPVLSVRGATCSTSDRSKRSNHGWHEVLAAGVCRGGAASPLWLIDRISSLT